MIHLFYHDDMGDACGPRSAPVPSEADNASRSAPIANAPPPPTPMEVTATHFHVLRIGDTVLGIIAANHGISTNAIIELMYPRLEDKLSKEAVTIRVKSVLNRLRKQYRIAWTTPMYYRVATGPTWYVLLKLNKAA